MAHSKLRLLREMRPLSDPMKDGATSTV